MPLLHPQRFTMPPEPIAELARSSHRWHLVRGEVLALPPPGARPPELPFELATPDTVLGRVDLEELPSQPFARPRLLTVERGRDFYFADASGGVAWARIVDGNGLLHPDVELHLGTPFSMHDLGTFATDDGHSSKRTVLLRQLKVGAPVYVLGRAQLVQSAALAGPRDAPPVPCFSADAHALHLYDEPAFRQLAAWYALPWYRKLSVLMRNR